MMTARDLILALYELNGGDYDKMVDDLRKKRHYQMADLESAAEEFAQKHRGEKITVITDVDYPMAYRVGYNRPPFVIIGESRSAAA